jgi:MscS family membrane protein
MDFLNKTYFDNPLRDYLLVAGVILLVLLFKKYLSRYLASLVYKMANRVLKTINKLEFYDLVVEPIGLFLVVTFAVFSIDKLNFPSAFHFKIYGHSSEDIIARIGPGIMIIAFIWLILRLIDFVSIILENKANLTPDARDNQLIVFFRDFLKVIIGIIGVLWIIKACFYQPIGNVLTGLSIVGAGLALAAKESLENLIASFIIFFDKPFFTGDLVKVNNITGTVEHIGLRSTRIRTAERTLVTVPNKQMVDTVLDNWSMRTARRAEIKLELHPQTTAAAIEGFTNYISTLLQSKIGVLESYEVCIKDISKSGVLIVAEYYTAPIPLNEYDSLKENLLLSIIKKMEEDKLGMIVGNVMLAN